MKKKIKNNKHKIDKHIIKDKINKEIEIKGIAEEPATQEAPVVEETPVVEKVATVEETPVAETADVKAEEAKTE